jgi:anti-sigma factor RsiW
MLSCEACEKYLFAFLDHELQVKESLDVEEHLRSCTSCSNRAEAEHTLRTFLRQQMTTPPLPEVVKQRIVRQAIQTPRPQRWRRWGIALYVRDVTIGVAAAAAVLLLVFRLFSFSSSGDDMVQKFAQEASVTYGTYRTQHMPPEVASNDDKMVTQWFNNHMGYPLKIPCITDQATKLLGGRICRLLDRKSAAMIYQRNGVEILLFAFKGGQMSMPERYKVHAKGHVFYVQSVAGHAVAIWQHGGNTYSMVGDLDREDLVQVATTIDYR